MVRESLIGSASALMHQDLAARFAKGAVHNNQVETAKAGKGKARETEG